MRIRRINRVLQRGASMVEYALLVGLIAVAVILVLWFVGQELDDTLADTLRCIQQPTSANCQLD